MPKLAQKKISLIIAYKGMPKAGLSLFYTPEQEKEYIRRGSKEEITYADKEKSIKFFLDNGLIEKWTVDIP